MTESVQIFTDGACRGNPGPGGWGALLRYKGRELELCGSDPDTTNNRMELLAAIKALQALKYPCSTRVTTDSIYVMKGISEWLPNWVRKGWRTASNAPVKNADLWKQLVAAQSPHRVEWCWVKGHAGHSENERADQLANRGIDEMLGSIPKS
ncbi:MAG: ribonuclease HI [Methylococcaceae bacterium]|jgi:Ribonuclease HI|nr:ribonuclease HI [Methylococcaceae bacterium]